MPILLARRMNLVALALFITALIAFVAFHFLPWRDSAGWRIWAGLYHVVRMGMVNDLTTAIAYSALITSSVVLIASPFLIVVLPKSRLAWWLLTLLSGFALLGLSGLVLYGLIHAGDAEPGLGMICLVSAQILHFIGLFFVRREQHPEPVIDG